eukprot:Tamp_23443.p2 GENE.Tamp_23443~~Tamp_23443.p2  ORF type:complete len:159 (-),score=24.25 Tamp_23443:236-712(-)
MLDLTFLSVLPHAHAHPVAVPHTSEFFCREGVWHDCASAQPGTATSLSGVEMCCDSSEFCDPLCNGCVTDGCGSGDFGLAQSQQALAVPLAAGRASTGRAANVATATPGHLAAGGHALVLAALQGVRKGTFGAFAADAERNAQAVSPVSAVLVRKLTV